MDNDWHMELGSIRKSTKKVDANAIINHIQERNEPTLGLDKIRLFKNNKISKSVQITKTLQENIIANDQNQWKQFKCYLDENEIFSQLWINFNVKRIQKYIEVSLNDIKASNYSNIWISIDVTGTSNEKYSKMIEMASKNLKLKDLNIFPVVLSNIEEMINSTLDFKSQIAKQITSQLKHLEQNVLENLANVRNKRHFLELIVKLVNFNQDCLNTINKTNESSVVLLIEQTKLTVKYLQSLSKHELATVPDRFVIPYSTYVKSHDEVNKLQLYEFTRLHLYDFDNVNKKFQKWIKESCYFVTKKDKTILSHPLSTEKTDFVRYAAFVCKLLIIYLPDENIYIDIFNEYVIKLIIEVIDDNGFNENNGQARIILLTSFSKRNNVLSCILVFKEKFKQVKSLRELKEFFLV